jgi:hypothetical protein
MEKESTLRAFAEKNIFVIVPIVITDATGMFFLGTIFANLSFIFGWEFVQARTGIVKNASTRPLAN